MFNGFKKFIARGSVIDMAVGVVMGGAVTAVVNSIVKNIINPLIAIICGKPDLDGVLTITINGATISFGAVIGSVLNFLIIAVAVYFFIVLPINKLREMGVNFLNIEKEKTDEEKRKEREEKMIKVLEDIRDSVSK
ncbi:MULTISPECIES: large conductance mechanosensitive channel protein MscL [Gardnerella]|jgi:large conductance mechanosensitive channel protein|uniref:Large-conductance mechanosensitive channel n=2 Tax=Gardnerella vaginalis TaxID=2702 RepID=A0A1Q6D2Z8_GARVA|nr:large conductance mechanosensitive channel protein MscL [Gardnerella vaginalis]CRH66616.1 Large-conductance mechanosensitive channel [Chlamydia trachomatis]AYZ21261.1 large conductance mechanosensitive channel protein MscL [Gardnerella vaginalis]EIK74012.1 large-conductance mechanosensitive channel [Gardnerella vaginalis 284V]EIK74370.1 large-conductance mechanosensitive channel [Gardnerella vaginalis 75712]EIK78044.1 large-conductance mechanosensitive channel [Gardnerella vaginalis 0288E]